MRAPLVLAFCVIALPLHADIAPPPTPGKPARTDGPRERVPAVLLAEWRKAENRATCAPLWFDDLGPAAGGRARRRTFSGGWGVVVDTPGQPGKGPDGKCESCGRSTIGVAGAGVVAEARDVERWPFQRARPGGARAGYGLSGDVGPDWLAYLIVPGQQCLYNVWSYRGRAHLEQLLDHVRVVTP